MTRISIPPDAKLRVVGDVHGDATGFAYALATDRFVIQLGDIVDHGPDSAATLRDERAHFDLVRCGVGIYGLDPFGDDPAGHGLEPAMSLRATVGAVKACRPGESTGYGRRFVAGTHTTVATIPVGYGDGYRRSFEGACVAVGGSLRPVTGTVSMDNITVDLGPGGSSVRPGDEAWLLGGGGPRAEELARVAGTINYEITCGISGRPSRLLHRDGDPV